jgi:hypothetical protein
MHIAILYDGKSVTEWQRQAIDLIARDHQLSFLIHEASGPAPRRQTRHALYYALNLVTIRNRLSRAVPLPVPAGALVRKFHPLVDGAWSALPPEVVQWLRDNRVDAVIKFGLNLLRIPEDSPPILSHHHGDPRSFRGRPAGFYELLGGELFIGQIVQVLCNRIDAGRVLAFTQTRVHAHSYRRTMLESFAASPALWPRALAALAADESVSLDPVGRNYRLPANLTVLRFALGCGWASAKRLTYGAFVEKRWNVSTLVAAPNASVADMAREIEHRHANWVTPPLLPGYTFYADGFFHNGPTDILVEAMNARTGKGEVVRILDGEQRGIRSPARSHISYPQTIEEDGIAYVVPETVGWSAPAAFILEGDTLRLVKELDIDVPSIIDPTLFRYSDQLYLFGTPSDRGPGELHLWVANSLFDRFERHPASPICIGSRGSRMAGQILVHEGMLVRVGQDCRQRYGDGVVWFRIDRLTAKEYSETLISELSFARVRGPHTLNRCGDTWLFDWYVEEVSLLAGVRRLLNRL